MTNDFADFLDALNREDVDYVVIGGMAVLSHIPYRTTRDIDVLIAPTLENAKRARRAVERWGGFVSEFSAEDFIAGDILSFGGLLRVEIHSRVPGVEWDEVRAGRVAGQLAGTPTHFAGLAELLAMKRATGRIAKDGPDVERLERLLKTLEEEE